VVTFHSLEDRIVKPSWPSGPARTPGGSRHAPPVEAGAPPSFQLISFKAIAPSDEAEVAANPRARSAKLRAAVRTEARSGGRRMSLSAMDRRVRGFRVVEMVASACWRDLILGVYLAKTMAGRERAEIADARTPDRGREVAHPPADAEVAYLEQPRRVERLADRLPWPGAREREAEITEDALIEVARHQAPAVVERRSCRPANDAGLDRGAGRPTTIPRRRRDEMSLANLRRLARGGAG
jgi:hypothetical protein